MSTIQEGKIQANGLEFGYLEAGIGPLVLCMHGFPDTANSYRHLLPALANAGFHAVAPFMRGYAPSQIPTDGVYQTAAFGQDTIALIEALGYEQADLVGHDWGASAVAAAALLAPQRVRRMVTMAVPYGGGMGAALLNDWAQQKRSWYMFFFQTALADYAVPANDFAFIENLWREWSPGWEWDREDMAALKACLAAPGTLQAALGYYRAALSGVGTSPELATLQAKIGTTPIEVPSLHLHGVQDGCIGVELTADMEQMFAAGFRCIQIEGCGHFLQLEDPERVSREILAFLCAD